MPPSQKGGKNEKLVVCIFNLFILIYSNAQFLQVENLVLDNYNSFTWKELNNNEKSGFVQGFAVGVLSSFRIASMRSENAIKFGMEDEAKGSKEVADAITYNLNVFNIPFGQLITGLNEFYKDYANLKIPIFLSIDFVGDRITGKINDNEAQERLLQLRKDYSKISLMIFPPLED